MNYVDDIDIEAFTKLSINNMLLDLDPYTVYMEKEEKSGIEMLTKYSKTNFECWMEAGSVLQFRSKKQK